MKLNFTLFSFLVTLFCISQNGYSQTLNDYRSNLSGGTAVWNVNSTWQRYDGSSWIAATAVPTSANAEKITIRGNDSVRLQHTTTIDQVEVENGAKLAIFNGSAIIVTLNNNPSGDDINILSGGRLYIAAAATVSGTGTIHNNTGGLFTLRNSSVLSVPVVSDGAINFGSPGVSAGTINGTTVTNNSSGTITWIGGNLELINAAHLVNNGTFVISPILGSPSFAPASTFINNTGAGNSVSNSGTITHTSAATTTTIHPPFTNTGTVGGLGTYAFSSITSNSGILSPGSSPGHLTVPANLVNTQPTNIAIEISTTGLVAGTNYDQLSIAGNTTISNAFLTITNNAAVTDPVGSIYTIVNTTTGNITGTIPPANITKPSNFTVSYSATTITLEKTAMFPLPVVWKSFEATAKNNQIEISWETSSEENASHFVIEHSAGNNTQYASITSVQAKGNSSTVTKYKYTFTNADKSKTNYFRINQVDLDGKSKYSDVRFVKFDKGAVIKVSAYPNPVKSELNINTQVNNISVSLSDMYGRTILTKLLQAGTDVMNMHQYAKGYYLLSFYEDGRLLETKKILKQ